MVSGRLALLSERLALVGERFALLGERLALVGERRVLLGERLAPVGERSALPGGRSAQVGGRPDDPGNARSLILVYTGVAARFFGNLGVYRFRRGTKRSRGRVSSFPLVTLEKITANDNFALAA